MLIDYVSAHCELPIDGDLFAWCREHVGERVLRYCPRSGDVRYEVTTWDRLRSDDYELSVRFSGSELWVAGSPARCIGDGDTVFGAGASSALDLRGCLARMVSLIEAASGHAAPALDLWHITRVDVTGNLALPSLAAVTQALVYLRGTEGGRYRGDSRYPESVNFGGKSRLRKAIAYAKGPHLQKLMRTRDYSGRTYSRAEIEEANRLLRLELRLGSQWFHVNRWQECTADVLCAQWEGYFERMFGTVEITAMDEKSLSERVRAVAKTEGQARAALACWCLIQQVGWHQAKELHAGRSWYRHIATLRRAGLGDSDISHGEVISIRRVELAACLVDTWDDLRRVA